MEEKTFEDYVNKQAADMVAELKAHAEKGGPGAWLDGDPAQWLDEAEHQIDHLIAAINEGTPEDVKKRAAHACNFIMMAAQTEMAAR